MVFTSLRPVSVGLPCQRPARAQTNKALAKERSRLFLVDDVVAVDKFAEDAANKVVGVDEILDGWMGLDIGPRPLRIFERLIRLQHCHLEWTHGCI